MSRRKSAGRQTYVEPSTSEDELGDYDEGPHSKKAKFLGRIYPHTSEEEDEEEEEEDQEASIPSEDDSGSLVESDIVSEEAEEDSSGVSETSSAVVSSKVAESKSEKTPVRAASKGTKTKKQMIKTQTNEHNETDGEDADSEGQGETFIPKLPALPAGEVEYSDLTIHPNTLTFLADLRVNNERDWFQQRELQYQAAKEDFDTFVYTLSTIIMNHDRTIPLLPAKDLTFRIYRDIRFSNDRTPYKTFLAAYFSRTGRKGPFAGYYISLEPGNKTLLACGLWQPPPEELRAVRDSIDAEPERWYEILEDPEFVQFFKGKEGLLKTSDKLKTCPKGFPKDHKEIDLLRLKSFTVSMTFKDEEVTSAMFSDFLSVVIEQMEPFVTMLNDIIRPDDIE